MQTNTEAVQFMNSLVSNLEIGVISFDMEGYINLINGKAMEYLGISGRTNGLIDTKVMTHFDLPVLSDLILECFNKTRISFHLSSVLYNDHYLVIDGKKLLDGILLNISDITESVIAKDEATQSLLFGQEMERRRLAKEIHDGIGPNMSTIKLQIDAIKRKTESDKIKSDLEEINEAISSIATDIRRISHDLMPNSLIDFGVVTALSNFSKKISEASDIEVTFQSNVKDGQLSREYKLNIFRIVQELVNNALKYSQCNNIEISLRKDIEGISILVADDGIGIDMKLEYKGIGITNIKSRVETLHGEFDMKSRNGGGVTVYILLPNLPIENNLNQ